MLHPSPLCDWSQRHRLLKTRVRNLYDWTGGDHIELHHFAKKKKENLKTNKWGAQRLLGIFELLDEKHS